MLTDWFGDGKLVTFGFQFRSQVWPGDTIIAAGKIHAIISGTEPTVEIQIDTANQYGDLLGKGYAVARVAP
jgi:hypothetical protein